MKKLKSIMDAILTSLIVILFTVIGLQTAYAECTYKEVLNAEEFPIGQLIKWSTLTESDNQAFVIEKSSDGFIYFEIGRIDGSGNSLTEKEYSFLDVNSTKANSFYRLQQIDFDGDKHFSEILKVLSELKNDFSVLKMSSVNTYDMFNVTLEAQVSRDVECIVKNWKNDIVLQRTEALEKGLNMISFDLSSLEKSIYKIEILSDQEVETITVQKVQNKLDLKQYASAANK